MFNISLLFLSLLSCSKVSESPSLVGKWYYASLDTKLNNGQGCDLRDTSKFYTKDDSKQIYEFFADGKVISTIKVGGQTSSSTFNYKLENGNMTWTINGISMPSIKVSNISSEGWRYEQDNYIWCPSKTAFKEYLNFKKY